jgi:hypothetical protein
MKYREGFGKFFAGIIGLLLWLFPIAGGIIGGYFDEHKIIGVLAGIVLGILLDIILLGPMVVFINIQNYLEEIRNKLYTDEDLKKEKILNEGENKNIFGDSDKTAGEKVGVFALPR